MKIFLRDVHHYLFDVEFTPRPGETHRIQTEIRRRAIAALRKGDATDGTHVVVAHSLGTVIAYDCLKRVAECPTVDGLLTIGSPLGLSEVQELRPGWSRDHGFPDAVGQWVNIFSTASTRSRASTPSWRTSTGTAGRRGSSTSTSRTRARGGTASSKYLRGPALRDRLRRMLEL
jgi:hypothetical protein